MPGKCMEDFDDFIGKDLRLFGVDDAFIDKLKWMVLSKPATWITSSARKLLIRIGL